MSAEDELLQKISDLHQNNPDFHTRVSSFAKGRIQYGIDQRYDATLSQGSPDFTELANIAQHLSCEPNEMLCNLLLRVYEEYILATLHESRH